MDRSLGGQRWRAAAATVSLSAVTLAIAASASPAVAAPAAWTGLSSDANWSVIGNWDPVLPVTDSTSLSFGPLSGACAASTSADTCYQANNDLTGVSVNSISIDDSAPYDVRGNQIALGAGGLTASFGGQDTIAAWAAPISLSASQTWTITGELNLVGPLSGAGSALTVDFDQTANAATGVDLDGGDSEVGQVKLSGPGSVDLNGSSALNASDRNSVNLADGATVTVDRPAGIGPLSSLGGEIDLRSSALNVDGGVTLDSRSTVGAELRAPGAGNFGQMIATGNVTLAGRLDLEQVGIVADTCPPLATGSVYTLVSTAGVLSGTFVNAPNGATLPTMFICPRGLGLTTLAKIGYTPHAMTATIVPAPTLAQLSAALSAGLTPSGKNARIGRLLKLGGTTLSFPPLAGELSIDWNARVRGRTVLVADGRANVDGAAKVSVHIGLTRSGKHLLEHARHLKVTASGLIDPAATGFVLVRAKQAFTLTR